MPTNRTLIVAAGAVAAVGLAGFGLGAALDDPADTVESIRLTDVRSQPAPESASGGETRQVPALEELSGVIQRDGDDIDEYQVGGVDLDFGPDSWVASAGLIEDYDGDGTREALRDELEGLVGEEARFRVRLDADGDDADVYTINDLEYRDVAGPAPWQADDAASEDEIRAAAAGAIGPDARVVDLEAEDGGTVAWEAEVVDAESRDYDVLLDASGNVIDVRRD